MKAWLLYEPGNVDNLRWEEVDDIRAGDGELQIKVMSTALNPVDYKVIENGIPAWNYPHIPGLDIAGVVLSTGAGVEDFRAGDRVAVHTSLMNNGAFAEKAVVNAKAAAKIPDNVSYDASAALLCAGMTAYHAVIQKLNHVDKDNILIHGGSGGVGGFAVQLASEMGLKVFSTASAENHEKVRDLGGDILIDYKNEDVTKRIMEETDGAGVDLIFNTVSSEEATIDLARLASSGQLAHIAGEPDMSGAQFFSLAPSIHKVALDAAHSAGTDKAIENLGDMTGALMEKVASGHLDALVDEVITAEELPDGLRKLKDGDVQGKIIVRMHDDQ